MRAIVMGRARARGFFTTSLALVGLGLAGCSGMMPDASDFKLLPSASSFLPPSNGDFARNAVNSTKPVTQADLVDQQGACAGAGAGAGRGVGLDMTECEVVQTLGAPASVQIARNAGGERVAEMTFTGGERAGQYRFVGGRLVEVERGAEAAPAPAPVRTAKTKPKSQKTTASAQAQ